MAFKYSYAVISNLPDSFSSFVNKSNYNMEKAREEHLNFGEILREIGVNVVELVPEERHPEGIKVDDVAVILNGTALMCNPFGNHRQGEVNLIRITLKKELGLRIVELNVENANLAGSDVLFTGKEIIVGLSCDTNENGAESVARAFPEYATTMVSVQPPYRNLKDAITVAGVNVFAVGQTEGAQKMLNEIMARVTYTYKHILLPEEWASQTIYCNGFLLHLSEAMIPQSFAVFENRVDYNQLPIDLQELYKGGVTLPKMVLFIGKNSRQQDIETTLL